MLLRLIASVSFCTLLVLNSACDSQLVIVDRSGTLDDDYVEEPISARSKKYENALLVSNAVLDKARGGEYRTIYDEFFDARLKSILDEPKFAAMMKQIEGHVGPIKRYKPMQWGFIPRNEAGEKFLYSVKIVEHERGMIRYLFVFADDGHYGKLVGFHAKLRTGIAAPGELG
jgi:hypothetical protein